MEKYLYPIPEQSFEYLKKWLHEIRASKPMQSPWDEEEFKLWIMNLWPLCWYDVWTLALRQKLGNKIFAWGLRKYWSENGNCTLAER